MWLLELDMASGMGPRRWNSTEIASNRDIRNSSKVEHAIQVQLRFCLVETSCDQEDCFPPNVNVKVNNKLCQLPVSISVNVGPARNELNLLHPTPFAECHSYKQTKRGAQATAASCQRHL